MIRRHEGSRGAHCPAGEEGCLGAGGRLLPKRAQEAVWVSFGGGAEDCPLPHCLFVCLRPGLAFWSTHSFLLLAQPTASQVVWGRPLSGSVRPFLDKPAGTARPSSALPRVTSLASVSSEGRDGLLPPLRAAVEGEKQ